jgi:hypothetical protein
MIYRGRGIPLLFRHYYGLGWIFHVMRAQDLHSVLVKDVLYIEMQITQHRQTLFGPVQGSVYLVLNIKIGEAQLYDKRRGGPLLIRVHNPPGLSDSALNLARGPKRSLPRPFNLPRKRVKIRK